MMGGRDYAAMSDPGRNRNFTRRWSEPANPVQSIGTICAGIENEVARQAIRHWLRQAATLDGNARQIAFDTANDIRRASGLDWGVLLGRNAA